MGSPIRLLLESAQQDKSDRLRYIPSPSVHYDMKFSAAVSAVYNLSTHGLLHYTKEQDTYPCNTFSADNQEGGI